MKVEQRDFGKTGLRGSVLGLGTVKWGRTEKVKYAPFTLPSDAVLEELLAVALESGMNVIDTAPAYGHAEERVGKLLAGRRDSFLIVNKTGEEFSNGVSHYDFSREHTILSVQRSLTRLRTDYIDLVLVHCPPDDVPVVINSPVLETLANLKSQGLIRAFGVSNMTIEGGLKGAELSDAVMAPYNLNYTEHRPVIDRARELGRAILLKKVMFSGNLPAAAGVSAAEACINAALSVPGVSSMIFGTISPAHLRENIAAAIRCAKANS